MPSETSQNTVSQVYYTIDNIVKKYINSLVEKAEVENKRLANLNSEISKSISSSEECLSDLERKIKLENDNLSNIKKNFDEISVLVKNSQKSYNDYAVLITSKKTEYDKILQNISKTTKSLQDKEKELAIVKQSIISENNKYNNAVIKNSELEDYNKSIENRISKMDIIFRQQDTQYNKNIIKSNEIKESIKTGEIKLKEIQENIKSVGDEYTLAQKNLETINKNIEKENIVLANILDEEAKIKFNVEKEINDAKNKIEKENEINKAQIEDLKNKARENEIYRNSLISIASDLLNSGADENKIRNIIAKLK